MEENPMIHLGGFVDGVLVYQFKVSYRSLSGGFLRQLNKYFPNGDEINKYLRSMTISFADIEKCEDVELEFLSDEIEKYCGFITKN